MTEPTLAAEIERRRTFAIISHPDISPRDKRGQARPRIRSGR